jgi:hypothetical protein
MKISFFKNLPKTDRYYKRFGNERIGKVRMLWIGPVFVLITYR